MTILINKSPLKAIEDLTATSQTVLQFMLSGEKWLKHAIANNDVILDVYNESTLLQNILSGLYDTLELTIDPLDITIGIDKLLSFNNNDLRDLYHYSIRTTESVPSRKNTQSSIDALYIKYGVVKNTDLALSRQQAEAKGLTNSVFLSSTKLADQLILKRLVNSALFSKIKKSQGITATNKAKHFAQSALSFLNLFKIQIFQLNNQQDKSQIPPIDELNDTLINVISANLACPILIEAPDQQALDKTIKNWQAKDKNIGFNELSTALYQLITNNTFSLNNKNEWENIAISYLKKCQQCIAKSSAFDAEALQQGNTWQYFFDNTIGKATLEYRDNGCLYIVSFSPANTSTNKQ